MKGIQFVQKTAICKLKKEGTERTFLMLNNSGHFIRVPDLMAE